MFPHLLDALRIPRKGRGRARTTPVAALGDKAYSSRAIRKMLRDRGIKPSSRNPTTRKGTAHAAAAAAAAQSHSTKKPTNAAT